MPSKDVGVDQTKLVPEDQYQEYVTERPSLRRRPVVLGKEKATISITRYEEVK